MKLILLPWPAPRQQQAHQRAASLRVKLGARGAVAVIPPKSNRTQEIDCNFLAYRWRHLAEHFFCKLKAFRRTATRYEKTHQSFRAMINLAAIKIAMR